MAIILDRDALKWFKPAKGQFQIYYKRGSEQPEYQPDFVAEAASAVYMMEPKARNEMDDAEVLAKRDAAVQWCKHASDYAASYSGKPWRYLLSPHDVITDNMTIQGLASQFATA
jgi:type III restriction enzyme